MSITRKFLKGIGCTDEQIETIIDEHTETTSALKSQINDYKADADKLEKVQKELDDLKEKTADYDDIKNGYATEKQAFDDFKKNVESEKALNAVKGAYKDLLKTNKVDAKRIDSIMKVTDFSGKKLGKDGHFENEEDLVSAIKSDWGDFITVSEERGAEVEKPLGVGGGAKSMTKDEIMKIKDTEERQKAITEHLELFE